MLYIWYTFFSEKLLYISYTAVSCYIHAQILSNKHIYVGISKNTEPFLMQIGTHAKQMCVLWLSNQNWSLGYIIQIKTTGKEQVLQTLLRVVEFWTYIAELWLLIPRMAQRWRLMMDYNREQLDDWKLENRKWCFQDSSMIPKMVFYRTSSRRPVTAHSSATINMDQALTTNSIGKWQLLSNKLSAAMDASDSMEIVYRSVNETSLYSSRPMVCTSLTESHRRDYLK